MNQMLNRQDAKDAMYCAPPRRQVRQETTYVNVVSAVARRVTVCSGFVGFILYGFFLAPLASWRLDEFLGALGVLAVDENHA
ncbi:hypothetical protein [Thiohalobacter sp. COW1]|uniref:hypothetical protein n=1 Tax=Thiohalobacter sp. COW1 TaxID=2795687 RepID=UPI001916AAB0|nr:hypothetical protein [Thiohalobacter sp. COW1]